MLEMRNILEHTITSITEETKEAHLIAKSCLNLTRNTIEVYEQKQETGILREPQDSYSDLLKKVASTAVLPEKQEELIRTFERENLIYEYEQENLQLCVDYLRRGTEGDNIWVRTKSRTTFSPESKEMFSFLFTFDISAEKLEESIVRNITNLEYDFLSIIKTRNHEETISNVYGTLVDYFPVLTHNYDENCRFVVENYVCTADREKAMRSLDFFRVKKELDQNDLYNFTICMASKDGVHYMKKYQFSYLDENKEKILMTRSDVTKIHEQEQKQLERMKAALKTARQAKEAKTDFLARMSHDIRTPMNGIIGITQLMLDGELPDHIREELEKIDASGQFLLGLVNDILDMTKVESGDFVLHPTPYKLCEFRKYLNAVIRPICEKKQITFVMDLKEGNEVPVIDHLRLNQIFFNLLSNAVKFTPHGGKVEILLQEEIKSGAILAMNLIVRDNGIGMSEEFQKHMFDKFSQELNGMEEQNYGSGLGLAIVQRLVSIMGGTLVVKSEQGRGTEFMVHIERPYILDNGRLEQEKKERKLVSLANKRILLCEDHPLNREIVVRVLNKEGMVVDCMENGKDGLMRFKIAPQDYYDAILMDIRMPVMDGLTASSEIRRIDRPDAKSIPIIALTANAFDEDIEKSKEAGINVHLAKPIEPQKLYSTLRELMKE